MLLIPVAVGSKAQFRSRSMARIAGSKLADGMDVLFGCLPRVLYPDASLTS